MQNQFYYTRTVVVPPEEGETEVKTLTLLDSFNVNDVLKTYDKGNGERIVLLKDMHERWQDVDIKNAKGRVVNVKREKDIYQSEFTLNAEDNARFVKLTELS